MAQRGETMLRNGDHVRVVAGRLEAHDGMVVALEGTDVLVDVEIFGRAVRLSFPAEELAAVPAEGDTWRPAAPSVKPGTGARRPGSESWRFEESVGALPHTA